MSPSRLVEGRRYIFNQWIDVVGESTPFSCQKVSGNDGKEFTDLFSVRYMERVDISKKLRLSLLLAGNGETIVATR